MKTERETLEKKAIALLKELISIPSYSSAEDKTADAIADWLEYFGITTDRFANNIIARNEHFDPKLPTLMLNSHHDTVKPNEAYTRDPFAPDVSDGKLFGLGSNDAGGALVSLLATFVHFYNDPELSHNLIIVASAEEESSGPNGLNSVLRLLPEIDVAIVGEPTEMELAVAEKGLVVFDATVEGTPSHAAHPNNDNSLYKTIPVLQWFRDFKFEKISEVLGEVKMTVTQIHAGSQHNVVPSHVNLVVDVRVNDCYSNAEIAEILGKEAPCEIKPRSLRLNSSAIPLDHPLVIAGKSLGRKTYGSPTLSDQAVLSCPSLKMGPGDSRRSHTADEFIYLEEIRSAIGIYIEMLEKFLHG